MTAFQHKWAELAAAEGHKRRLPPSPPNPTAAQRASPQVVAKIDQMAESGKSFREIGEALGKSRQQITQIACAHGIKGPKARQRKQETP